MTTKVGDGSAGSETKFLVAPKDEGGTIYRAPGGVTERLSTMEEQFRASTGGPVLFEDEAAGRLTPFAVRLFRKGYVSVRPLDDDGRVLEITALHEEIEARLHKVLDAEPDVDTLSDIVIPEADLPFEGPLAALPEGMRGVGHGPHVFGVRPGEHPTEVLENLLYGQTGKDDPESSHHGEHEISDGVDRG